jgi:bacterioferritin-associated ferredoxin
MYICLCNAVTDHDIRREAADGVRSFAELQARTGCSDCCGYCASCLSPQPEPSRYTPQQT